MDIFVSKGQPFEKACLKRAALRDLPGGVRVRVATAEDIVLIKLDWYRRGGEQSERQWTDVQGVLRALGPGRGDRPHLVRWSEILGVRDLLDRALAEAGWPADVPGA